MRAVVTGAGRRVPHRGALPRLATPGGAAAMVDILRVVLAAVFVALALAGLTVTGGLLAGPIPEVGPQPGF